MSGIAIRVENLNKLYPTLAGRNGAGTIRRKMAEHPCEIAIYTARGHNLRFCPRHRHARTLLSGIQADRDRWIPAKSMRE